MSIEPLKRLMSSLYPAAVLLGLLVSAERVVLADLRSQHLVQGDLELWNLLTSNVAESEPPSPFSGGFDDASTTGSGIIP